MEKNCIGSPSKSAYGDCGVSVWRQHFHAPYWSSKSPDLHRICVDPRNAFQQRWSGRAHRSPPRADALTSYHFHQMSPVGVGLFHGTAQQKRHIKSSSQVAERISIPQHELLLDRGHMSTCHSGPKIRPLVTKKECIED